MNYDLTISRTRILPDCGDIIGWKKCKNNVIVKLLIPETSKRSHAFGRKCRASSVTVLEVYCHHSSQPCLLDGISLYDSSVIYRKGEVVSVVNFNEDFTIECSTGIHFYITRSEAEDH